MSGFCPARRSGFMPASMSYGGGGIPSGGPFVAQWAESETGAAGVNHLDVTLPSATQDGDWLVAFVRTAIDGNSLEECWISSFGGPLEWTEVVRVRDENPVVNSQQVIMVAPAQAGLQTFRQIWYNANSVDPVFIDYRWFALFTIRRASELIGAAGQSVVAAAPGIDVLDSGAIADIGGNAALVISACTNETEFGSPPEPALGTGQTKTASWGSYGLGLGDYSLGAEQTASGVLRARYTAQCADEYFVLAAAFR